MAKAAGAVEYIDCISAVRPLNVYPDMTLNNLMVSTLGHAGALKYAEYPFIAIAPWFTLPGVAAPERVTLYGSNRSVSHLNGVQIYAGGVLVM